MDFVFELDEADEVTAKLAKLTKRLAKVKEDIEFCAAARRDVRALERKRCSLEDQILDLVGTPAERTTSGEDW